MTRRMRALWLMPIFLMVSCNWMPGPMQTKCDERRVREIAGPNGKVKAVEYHSVCEGNVHVATIEIAGAAGSDRATAMHAQLVSRTEPPVWPELKVEWKSDKELWIKYPAGVDVQCISSPPNVAVHCLDASIGR